MNASAPLPSGRYSVAQSRVEVNDRMAEAIRRHTMMKIELLSELGIHQICFRVRTTDHDDQGSLIYGLTSDHRTININLPYTGEVTAQLGA